MQKAVFLDRDGVINNDEGHYYVFEPEDFVLNNDVISALKIFQDKGYILIVISNQGGVAKGEYTKSQVNDVHKKFLELTSREDITIQEIYYCPHHSAVEKCLCRKPNSMMIEKAIARFSIEPSESYLIGDSLRDIQAAEKAGVKGIKIDSNQSLLTVIQQIK